MQSAVTARFVICTGNQLTPRSRNLTFGAFDSVFDTYTELVDDVLPLLRHEFFGLGNDILTTLGSFIAGLQKFTVLLLSLSNSSIVDVVSVLLDERSGLRAVPGLDIGLNVIQIID